MPNKSTNKIQDSHQNDNTLRLGVRELDALLDKIEQIRPSMDNPDRNFVRWNLRIVRVDLTIEHQTGSKVVLPVATRNISRGGIAVLHSSFVYPNSRCHVRAVLEGGHKLDIKGTVKRCDHIGGKVHELGIKFDNEISTKDILGLDPMQEAYSLERIDPKSLQGNILIINESEFDQQIMLKLLEETELSIAVAENSETAIKRAQKKGCELILLDIQVGSETASDILLELRAQGIDAPVLIMASDSSAPVRDELRMAGASGLISKPLTKDRIHQALAEFLMVDGSTGPIYSTLENTDPAYDLLGKFLSNLSRTILTLENGLRESDKDACLTICRSLASSAASLGYTPIGELAVLADRALSNGNGVRDAAADIRRLIIACRRVKAKPASAA